MTMIIIIIVFNILTNILTYEWKVTVLQLHVLIHMMLNNVV